MGVETRKNTGKSLLIHRRVAQASGLLGIGQCPSTRTGRYHDQCRGARPAELEMVTLRNTTISNRRQATLEFVMAWRRHVHPAHRPSPSAKTGASASASASASECNGSDAACSVHVNRVTKTSNWDFEGRDEKKTITEKEKT